MNIKNTHDTSGNLFLNTQLNPTLNCYEHIDRASCTVIWQKLHRRSPPKYLSVQFMQKSLMFEAQVKALGGHSKAVQKVFKQALNAKDNQRNKSCISKPSLKPGMHLVREWNGKTYRVEVTEQGFLLNDRSYQSLSAIAKHITGAHWSGPRFFGLGK